MAFRSWLSDILFSDKSKEAHWLQRARKYKFTKVKYGETFYGRHAAFGINLF